MEGIQKAAVKVMTGRHYEDYEKGLESPNMKTLVQRRQVLGLKFAKSCLKNEKVKNFFPLNWKQNKNTRNPEKFKVNFARWPAEEKYALEELIVNLVLYKRTLSQFYFCFLIAVKIASIIIQPVPKIRSKSNLL